MAKKFKFRLEAILKLRTEKVDEAKNSLKAILQYRYAKEEEIATLQNNKQEFLTTQHNISKASDMQANKDYVKNLDAQIQKKEIEKEKILEIENERRKRLAEAVKEEKIILKLKEKKYEEYKQELNKEETKFIDEIATKKFIQKKKK
jgi:flagellar FliJ protein